MKNELENNVYQRWGYKKFFLTLIVFLGGIFAATTNVDKASIPTFQTLQNPGFEQSTQYWSASGGNFVTSTGSPLFGNAYGSWDASASSQTLCSNSVTVPLGLANTNGEAFIYSTGTVAYTHTVEVRDGSGNTLASTSLVNSPTLDGYTAAKTSLNFLFPANTESIRLCVVSQTNEPGIKLDGAYLGSSTNVGTVAQARFYGSLKYARTASCKWTATGTGTPANPSADTDCPSPTVTGGVTAPSTKIPAVRLQNAPPGTYHFVARGRFGAESADRATYRFSDGTNTSDSQMCGGGNVSAFVKCPTINGTFTYTTAQSDITVTIQLSAVSSGADSVIDASSTDGGSTQGLAIDVFYYPNADQSVYATDQSDYGWTAYTPTGAWSSNTTYTGFHRRVNGNLELDLKVAVTGAPTSASLTINLPTGLTIDTSKLTDSTAAIAALDSTVVIRDSGTDVFDGRAVYNSTTSIAILKDDGDGTLSAVTQAAPMTWASGDFVTIKVTGLPIVGWASTNNTPMLVNSVINSSTGITRVEASNINCDASSAITSQHGSWVSSVGNVSGGACAVTLTTGTFSAAPYCLVEITGAISTGLETSVTASSATAVSVDCEDDASNACTSYDFNLFCIGAK